MYGPYREGRMFLQNIGTTRYWSILIVCPRSLVCLYFFVDIPYILESNPHPVFATFLNEKN
jgi:hypothetical protein